MGRGRKGSGVEPRDNSIRVSFTWNGERCRERLDKPPTPPNLKYATKLVADINKAIANGSFLYADYFPDSPRALRSATGPQTFGAYCALYLQGRAALAPATRSQYENELERWKARIGESTEMAGVRHSWLAAQIGKVGFPGAKMRNNSLIPLRGVFDLWVRDDPRHRVSPMDGVENATVQHALPDPFELAEVELILADLAGHYDERVAAYYEFAFFAGFRPEEQIALLWSKVDFRRAEVLVDRARTFKGTDKGIKTYKARVVHLSSRAMAAIERMRKWTAMKPHGHVFENPVTGEAWHDERSQRDHYWKPALKRLRLRERRQYQTRSTYVTMNLMAGANPGWVALQAGHSVQMMWKSYVRWIEGADRGRERAKLEAALTLAKTGSDAG